MTTRVEVPDPRSLFRGHNRQVRHAHSVKILQQNLALERVGAELNQRVFVKITLSCVRLAVPPPQYRRALALFIAERPHAWQAGIIVVCPASLTAKVNCRCCQPPGNRALGCGASMNFAEKVKTARPNGKTGAHFLYPGKPPSTPKMLGRAGMNQPPSGKRSTKHSRS